MIKRSYMLLAEQFKSNNQLQCLMMHIEMGMNMCGCAAADVRTILSCICAHIGECTTQLNISNANAALHIHITCYIDLNSRWLIAKDIIWPSLWVKMGRTAEHSCIICRGTILHPIHHWHNYQWDGMQRVVGDKKLQNLLQGQGRIRC